MCDGPRVEGASVGLFDELEEVESQNIESPSEFMSTFFFLVVGSRECLSSLYCRGRCMSMVVLCLRRHILPSSPRGALPPVNRSCQRA